MELTLFLLGETEVRLDGKLLDKLSAEKACALFFYLVVESHTAHRRDSLAEMFWPEKPPGYGRNNLKQSLSLLRNALGDRDLEEPFILSSNRDLQFNSGCSHQVDVQEFENLSQKVISHPHSGSIICENCADHLNRAVNLYRDDFLSDFYLADSPEFNEWTLFKRESYKRMMADSLSKLISFHEEKGEIKTAAEYGKKLINLEPWSESNHRRLMALLAASGKRSAALKQYHACETMLASEFAIKPTPETTSLYEEIKKWNKETGDSPFVFNSHKYENDLDAIDETRSPGIREWIKISISLSFLILVGIIYILFGQNWFENKGAVQPDIISSSPSEINSARETDEGSTLEPGNAEHESGSPSNNNPDPTLAPESTAPGSGSSDSSSLSSISPELACLPGEELLYLEDFQDGQAQGWPEIEYKAQEWRIEEDPLASGNLALNRPSTYDGSADLRDQEFGDAVWRLRIMFPDVAIANFTWHLYDKPYQTENGLIDYSGYDTWIHFPAIHVNRNLNPNGEVSLRWGGEDLRLNSWHLFEISTFQGTVEVWVDGEMFVEYTDPEPLRPGRIAIGVGMEGEPENHTKVYFDDFIICGLNSPFVSAFSE